MQTWPDGHSMGETRRKTQGKPGRIVQETRLERSRVMRRELPAEAEGERQTDKHSQAEELMLFPKLSKGAGRLGDAWTAGGLAALLPCRLCLHSRPGALQREEKLPRGLYK